MVRPSTDPEERSPVAANESAARRRASLCRVCGKELGTRRQRQGISVHPACRRSGFDSRRLEQAMEHTHTALHRLKEHSDPESEVGQLFSAARDQARELVGDLRRLRDFYAPSDPPSREELSGRPPAPPPGSSGSENDAR